MTEQQQLSAELVESLTAMPEAVNRLHRALIGDATIGHRGVVERLGMLEQVERSIPAVHASIDDRRIEGDRRAHERIDEIAEKFETEVDAIRDDGRRIERKVDRLIWLFLGAGAVTGGGVGFLVRELVNGGL